MNNFHIHMCESLTPNRRKVLGKNSLDGTNILSTELNRDKILVIAVIAAQEFLLLRGPIPAVCASLRLFGFVLMSSGAFVPYMCQMMLQSPYVCVTVERGSGVHTHRRVQGL